MPPAPPDSILLVSFGGPEGPDDVMPFLRNVTAGRDVPSARLETVAERYRSFGGRSPINDLNRELATALAAELDRRGIALPIRLGNRNWHPLLADTLADMADHGSRRAIAIITSAFSSYPGCRQYREDVARARARIGPHAPAVDRIRWVSTHPGFVEAVAEVADAALGRLRSTHEDLEAARLVFTAHSIPTAMAATSPYVSQLEAASAQVAARCAVPDWDLVYQSRSGSPHVPWLGPDVSDHLRTLPATGSDGVVVVPLGFVADHMEVVWDLDVEAARVAAEIGLPFVRAATVGTTPRFVSCLADLVEERIVSPPLAAACPPGCCPATGGGPRETAPAGVRLPSPPPR